MTFASCLPDPAVLTSVAMSRGIVALTFLAVLGAQGCSQSTSPASDAGGVADAGMDAGADAARPVYACVAEGGTCVVPFNCPPGTIADTAFGERGCMTGGAAYHYWCCLPPP